FADSLNTEAIRFALAKAEVECDYFRTGYFDIFFERDFIRQMKLFLPEEVMQSRGIGIKEKERKELVARIGRRVAFIVGTNEYAAATQWTRLANPVADARAMADVLARNFGFDTILLLDKPADSIYSRLLQLAQTLQPSDQLLIYVGGHGDFDERLFDDGFIVTADSKPLTEDPFRNTYVQYSKLSRLINRLPPMQILTVLDVCFGGTFDERVARNKARGGYDDLSNAAFLQDKLKKRTRLYLTSGSKNVVPDGYAGRHSPFALRLLEAFETRGGTERMLTASALYQFVQKLPSKPMLGSFGDDEVGSEFVLVGR
ncbi:MAG: caspase family protein, partial [Chitinophagaceae bacterium]